MAAGEVKGALVVTAASRRPSPRAWGPGCGSRVRGSRLRPGDFRVPVQSPLLIQVLPRAQDEAPLAQNLWPCLLEPRSPELGSMQPFLPRWLRGRGTKFGLWSQTSQSPRSSPAALRKGDTQFPHLSNVAVKHSCQSS